MRLFLVRALCVVESIGFFGIIVLLYLQKFIVLVKINRIQLLYSYLYDILVGGKY